MFALYSIESGMHRGKEKIHKVKRINQIRPEIRRQKCTADRGGAPERDISCRESLPRTGFWSEAERESVKTLFLLPPENVKE